MTLELISTTTRPLALLAQTIGKHEKAAQAREERPAEKAVAKPLAAQTVLVSQDTGLAAQLAKTGQSVAADPAKADETDEAKLTSPEEMEKSQRQAAKSKAREQVMQLIERIKLIKKFASDDPKIMARMLAQLAKELKAAIEAYREAGGKSGGGWQTSLNTDVKTTDENGMPRDPGQVMWEQYKGSEASGDMEIVRIAKGIGQNIRDLLNKAKIQTGVQGPDEETAEDMDETEETLKEVDKALEKLDRDVRASSPAAAMFGSM